MEHPIDSFGQLLQRARLEKKHLTPRDLARSANVSEAVYKGWEADQNHPNRLQLTKMFGANHWLQAELPKKAAAVITKVAPLTELEPRGLANAIAPTFGEALQAERKREGLSQEDLGALLDPQVTWQAVSAWEVGTSIPVRANLAQLYELFPNLALAPAPPAQDIPVPSGGKGGSRAASAATPVPTWIQPTLTAAAPLRPEPPAGAPTLYTFHTPAEPMTTTPVPSPAPVLQDSQLIAYVHTLCGKLHGGEWSIRFSMKDGAWQATAEAATGVLEYTGIANKGGAPHEALINLLRDARKELERRRKMLEDLERELPKEALI
jgi:DNA-binding transcriptional regulator YiaG